MRGFHCRFLPDDFGPASFFFLAGTFCCRFCWLLLPLIGQSFFTCWSDLHLQQNIFSTAFTSFPQSACLWPSCKQLKHLCLLPSSLALPLTVVLSALTVAFLALPKGTPKTRLSFAQSSLKLSHSSVREIISARTSFRSLRRSAFARSSALAFFSCSSSISPVSDDPDSLFPFSCPPPLRRGISTTPFIPAIKHFVTGLPSPEHHPFFSTKAIGSALISSPTLESNAPSLTTIFVLVIGSMVLG
mmetsp:Transcript_33190/g.54910  ORF Transcript_33190/g.54910 Transcript_33190/m.54910 type:complete len:244 (-) Transcript_33190:45-776(-)